jgi:site-specific recombinase XerD
LPWGELRYQHTAFIRSQLTERYSPATTNKILSAVKRVLKEAWRLGQIPTEDYHRAIDLKSVRGKRLPTGRSVPKGEVKDLLQVCREDIRPLGRRDLALLVILYAGGLRRSEVVGLDLADYLSVENAVKVRSGKGDKDRIAYLGKGVEKPLQEWLEIRGTEPGPLFYPISWKGKIIVRRLTDQSVAYILTQRAKEAGLGKTSPHDFRRTFITSLLEAGADISTVQQLAGHANVATTARYDRRGEESKKQAAKLIEVPEE